MEEITTADTTNSAPKHSPTPAHRTVLVDSPLSSVLEIIPPD